jgi:hypothetical protein
MRTLAPSLAKSFAIAAPKPEQPPAKKVSELEAGKDYFAYQ